MPIFHIDLAEESPAPNASPAQSLAAELGHFLDAQPGHVWVRITHCPESHYAENDSGPFARWAFVRVILRDLPPEAERVRLASGITERVARATKRDAENVHVIFEPAARGRIAFGGELVT